MLKAYADKKNLNPSARNSGRAMQGLDFHVRLQGSQSLGTTLKLYAPGVSAATATRGGSLGPPCMRFDHAHLGRARRWFCSWASWDLPSGLGRIGSIGNHLAGQGGLLVQSGTFNLHILMPGGPSAAVLVPSTCFAHGRAGQERVCRLGFGVVWGLVLALSNAPNLAESADHPHTHTKQPRQTHATKHRCSRCSAQTAFKVALLSLVP